MKNYRKRDEEPSAGVSGGGIRDAAAGDMSMPFPVQGGEAVPQADYFAGGTLPEGGARADMPAAVGTKGEAGIADTGTGGTFENMLPDVGAAVIDQAEVDRAYDTLREYKSGKAALEARVIANEEWWKQHNGHYDKNGKPVDGENTAWLFNSVANKHADAMDNKPCANVLAREKDDEVTAETLSSIIPVILDRNRFAET